MKRISLFLVPLLLLQFHCNLFASSNDLQGVKGESWQTDSKSPESKSLKQFGHSQPSILVKKRVAEFTQCAKKAILETTDPQEVFSQCERELDSYLVLHHKRVRKQVRLRVVAALIDEVHLTKAIPAGKSDQQSEETEQ